MPKPLAICLEDLAPGSSPRYVRCVARSGREPGLCLDERGGLLWMSDAGAACELWVSMDDRLILFRRTGGGPIKVTREDRSLDVPAEKPVVLLDQDRVDLGGRALRVHVHGPATRVHAPAPLPEPSRGRAARAAASVAVLGAAFGVADCKKAGEGAETPDGARPGPTAPAEAGAPADAVLYVPAEAGLEGSGEPGAADAGPPPDVAIAADGSKSNDAGPDVAPDVAGDEIFELEVSGDAVDGSGGEDGRRIRDAQRIEVRIRPPRPVMPRDGR
jgi:hypothetical protein